MRESSSEACFLLASLFTTIVLNFKQLNERPPRPTLRCTKKTGPRESNLINKAHRGIIQLRMKTSTKEEISMSDTRLRRKKAFL
jgi:hypothetical protein